MGIAKASISAAPPSTFCGYDFIHAHVRRESASAASVLETGCGAGFYSKSVMRGYVGTDITAEDYRSGITRSVDVVCSAEMLPFRGESFDLVFCVASVDYFVDPQRAFREAARVLRPGGKFLVVTYNRRKLLQVHRDDPRHQHVFSTARLLSWFSGANLHPRLLDASEPRSPWKRALLRVPLLRFLWRSLGMWRVVIGTKEM